MLYYEQNLIIPREDKFKCLVTILYTSAMPIVSSHLLADPSMELFIFSNNRY